MKNFILYSSFILATVCVAPTANAAFPVNTQQAEESANLTTASVAGSESLTISEAASLKPAPAPAPAAPAMGGGPGLSIAALVLGIVAVLTSFWTIAIVAGALAIIFGALNLHGPKPGMALAGLILGIIGVALALII
jgi:hypothetical protein